MVSILIRKRYPDDIFGLFLVLFVKTRRFFYLFRVDLYQSDNLFTRSLK